MSGDPKANRAIQAKFLTDVARAGQVWGLAGGQGWAAAPENGPEGRLCMAFWSSRAGAERAAVAEWQGYRAQAIALGDFISQWLPGMASDEMLLGLDWDQRWQGPEAEPDDVEEALVAVLEQMGAKVGGAPRGSPRASVKPARPDPARSSVPRKKTARRAGRRK